MRSPTGAAREALAWLRRLLALLALLLPTALAAYALTEPWAQARVFLLLGITRSPGAIVLVLLTLLLTLLAGVTAIGRRRNPFLAAGVHLGSGVLMCVVSWLAFRMIRDAGVKALGFIPLAWVRPGPGLRYFFLAALLLLGLGLAELAIAVVLRRRMQQGAAIPSGRRFHLGGALARRRRPRPDPALQHVPSETDAGRTEDHVRA